MEAVFGRLIMEIQAFTPLDTVTILTLAGLEGILSVDNALVLAILVRTLPKSQQKKALLYGIVGAFLFRFIALVFASYLMSLTVFKLIGGGYLLYIAMKHMFFFYKEDANKPRLSTSGNFWKLVLVVELTDIAFSLDSIMTAVAMTDKLAVVWFGGILGIIFLRFAATFFVRLLERLPKLEDLAYQLVFFIGTKLFIEGFGVKVELWVFWMMMGVIVIIGSALVYKDYHQRKSKTRYQDSLIDRLRKGEVEIDEVLALESVPKGIIDFLRENGHLEIKKKREKPKTSAE